MNCHTTSVVILLRLERHPIRMHVTPVEADADRVTPAPAVEFHASFGMPTMAPGPASQADEIANTMSRATVAQTTAPGAAEASGADEAEVDALAASVCDGTDVDDAMMYDMLQLLK